MNINFATPITDLDNKAIENMTLRSVAIAALLQPLAGDEKLDATKKIGLFDLALEIHDTDELDLRVEDVALIKERIAKAYPPLVVGRAYALLDPKVDLAAGNKP